MAQSPLDTDEQGVHQDPGLPIAAAAAPLRAIDAARNTATGAAADHLLSTTGPLAELSAADLRGVLDEARRRLIVRKGAGVVFEAHTVVRLQDASERYGVNVTARLAGNSNAERADIHLVTAEGQIDLQLKTGSDKYIRAAVRACEEGVILVAPSDATGQPATASACSMIEVDGVWIETPTRRDLEEHSHAALDRLSRGESSFSLGDLAKTSLANSLVDGLTAVVFDICAQRLSAPDAPIDWRRAARCLLKTAGTSAAASLLAGVMTRASLANAGRAIDATACMRAARVSSSVLPRVIDTIFDLSNLRSGEITDEQFDRQLARNAGAVTVEVLGFQLLARFTARLGPIGRTIVTLVGHLVLTALGSFAGELVYELVRTLGRNRGSQPALPTAAPVASLPPPSSEFAARTQLIVQAMEVEQERRIDLAARRRCEEPRCGRPHHGRGLCGKHYMRWWRLNRRHLALARVAAQA